MIHDYSSGRKLQPAERLLFSGAARDPRVGGDLRRLRGAADRPGADDRDRDAAGGGRQRALRAGAATRAAPGASAPASGAPPDGDRRGVRGAPAAPRGGRDLHPPGRSRARGGDHRGRLRPRQPGLLRRLGAARGRGRRDRRCARSPSTCPTSARRSRPPASSTRRLGYAAFVDAALAALGIERVHLVLHDFGGPIGLAWAATHADAHRLAHPDRHRHPPRLQVAPAGADLAHPGARRALPGDGDAARLPHLDQPRRAARAPPPLRRTDVRPLRPAHQAGGAEALPGDRRPGRAGARAGRGAVGASIRRRW